MMTGSDSQSSEKEEGMARPLRANAAAMIAKRLGISLSCFRDCLGVAIEA
jgi:hypothetical protein